MKKVSQMFALMAVVGLMVACDRSATTGPVEDATPSVLQSRSAPSKSEGIVYVVHGINGTDLGLSEALPVDVSLNGACALPGFTFGEIVGPLELPVGSYDIAIGLAAVYGYEIQENFDAPLVRRNLVQLWQRWHMTLTRWLRSYLFTPISRGLMRRGGPGVPCPSTGAGSA